LAERFAVCALPPRHLGGPRGGRRRSRSWRSSRVTSHRA